MNVTHICPTYDPDFAHWHEKVAKKQQETGHNVEVITTTLSPNGSFKKFDQGKSTVDEIQVTRYPARTIRHQIVPLVNPSRLQASCDLLHLHSYGQILCEMAAIVNYKTPMVLKADVGAAYPDTNPLKKIERHLVDAVTGFDEEEVGFLTEIGFPPQSIYKVPHGVDYGRFHTAGEAIDRDKSRLLMVCQVIPEKNIELSIKSLTRISGTPTLRIVGPIVDEEYHERLQNLIKSEGVGDQVEFAGLVPHQQIQNEFAKASVVLVTSHSESGGPASMLEAIATGRPTVTVPLSLANELSEGVIPVPYDPDEFATKIDCLLTDQEKWENESKKASQMAIERDWNQIVARLDEIYQSL